MKQVQAKFKKAGLRVTVDRGAERLAKQIRVAGQASVELLSAHPRFDDRCVVNTGCDTQDDAGRRLLD